MVTTPANRLEQKIFRAHGHSQNTALPLFVFSSKGTMTKPTFRLLALLRSVWLLVSVNASSRPWHSMNGFVKLVETPCDSFPIRSFVPSSLVNTHERVDPARGARSIARSRSKKFGWRRGRSSTSVNAASDRICQALARSRGGGAVTPWHQRVGGDHLDNVVRIVGTATQLAISCGRMVLPPTIRLIGAVVSFYRSLPQDAILAQIGLVYCFAGGYYPTLFSSLQAARHCGLDIVISAIQDLSDEAVKVIEATADIPRGDFNRQDLFLYQTNIVIKTVDPVKINQAAGALYTSWLGISAVLEKEYARVISLSLTMSYYLELGASWILERPVKLVVPKEYHKWVPVVIGWTCKGVAMRIAWRIQRVLTASTSAIFGGVLFARATLRMLHRRGFKLFGWIDETGRYSHLDEIIGFTVAGIGFYTQMQTQFANNFSFEVPFPLSLVTWPFDWAEKWIQWSITRNPR